jgi:hypothetical protein
VKEPIPVTHLPGQGHASLQRSADAQPALSFALHCVMGRKGMRLAKNRTGLTNFLPGTFWGAGLFRSFELPFQPNFPPRDLS